MPNVRWPCKICSMHACIIHDDELFPLFKKKQQQQKNNNKRWLEAKSVLCYTVLCCFFTFILNPKKPSVLGEVEVSKSICVCSRAVTWLTNLWTSNDSKPQFCFLLYYRGSSEKPTHGSWIHEKSWGDAHTCTCRGMCFDESVTNPAMIPSEAKVQ